MNDNQDLFSFLDQLLSTDKGRKKYYQAKAKLPNELSNLLETYDIINSHKKNALNVGTPIHLDTNKNAQGALSTYHPWRGRVLGQDFINTYPSQWAHIVDALPQTPFEQRQLQNWWPIMGERRNTAPAPNWNPVQPNENVSGPYRPDYTANWSGIKPTRENPMLGMRPELYVQRVSTVKPHYDAWNHDYENWPVIPAKSDEVFDVTKLKDRIKDAEFELKWSLLPGIYRDITQTKRKILSHPWVAKQAPKSNPPAAAPFKPKNVEFKGSATEGLYTPSADKTAIYEAIRNLDEPFHPIISAGMIHTKFDNPVMMQRVKQQNEAVMKNRMNARKESTMWDDTALYGSETDRPGRLMNDAELKILDPREWLPGFTREHMDLTNKNSLSDKELRAWQRLIHPVVPNVTFGTGKEHPGDIRQREGVNKRPDWRRNVLPPRSANTNPPPPTFEELRKRYPNVPDAEIHRLMKLGGMGGLGVLGIQTLNKAKRIGGR